VGADRRAGLLSYVPALSTWLPGVFGYR